MCYCDPRVGVRHKELIKKSLNIANKFFQLFSIFPETNSGKNEAVCFLECENVAIENLKAQDAIKSLRHIKNTI